MSDRHGISLLCSRPALLVCKALALVLVVVLAGACHRKPHPRPKVVASIFPVFDLTRRVAGPDADVDLLIPPELSPEQYLPSPANMQQVAGAGLAVSIGGDLDTWVAAAMARSSPTGHVLRLADRVPTVPRQLGVVEVGPGQHRPSPGAAGPSPTGAPDPIDVHVWLDPQRAILMTRAIADELCRVDPDHTLGYRARAVEVSRSLDALDREILARTAAWPERRFLTYDDAFRYYTAHYHLDAVLSIAGGSGQVPTIRTAQQVLARVGVLRPAAVFGEAHVDSQTAAIVASAARLPYGVLDAIGGKAQVDSYEALLRADTDIFEQTLRTPRPASAADASAPHQ